MTPPTLRQPIVAVCGAGSCGPELAAEAESVGIALAQAGVALICGGLGGVMEAACRGARAAGGVTIGVLPGADPSAANRFVQIALATNMGEARNALIVQAAASVIAIGGEYGTLSEIALARKLGSRVVGLHTWELGVGHITAAATPAEAVVLAIAQE
ncbi:TIGR00725 family protein [Chloroflexia bacterium SDU3-3]|nr:TIGR00725 family protein [Chloroflexia bacterium SDU3-3]